MTKVKWIMESWKKRFHIDNFSYYLFLSIYYDHQLSLFVSVLYLLLVASYLAKFLGSLDSQYEILFGNSEYLNEISGNRNIWYRRIIFYFCFVLFRYTRFITKDYKIFKNFSTYTFITCWRSYVKSKRKIVCFKPESILVQENSKKSWYRRLCADMTFYISFMRERSELCNHFSLVELWRFYSILTLSV